MESPCHRGEAIDFVVDIDEVLNNDQFLWTATITGDAESSRPTAWDSKADFPVNHVDQLAPLEQVAQILFCSNEFLFID